MKIRLAGISALLVIALALCGLAQAAGQDSSDQDAAVQAAQQWLALADGGQYEANWEAAAEYFRNAVGKEQWAQTLKAVRAPLGEVLKRELAAAQRVTELPGAPDGDYAVMSFAASFASKAQAVETVTATKEPDGVWRISGYYIR